MQGSTSKLRNVYGEARLEKYEDVQPQDSTTEGSLIDVNGHFLAVSWKQGGGGAVAILDSNVMTRCNNVPLIRGHTSQVLDMKFSPFSPNLLATASDDATVRLWQIPQGGLTEDVTHEQIKYTGHHKKVGILHFNPSVSEVIASASQDNTVQVWNILSTQNISKIHFNENILSLDWNHNGSLVGLTTRDKLVHVADPRANKVGLVAKAHDGTKSQKMAFLGNTDYLFVSGSNSSNDRQIKLYDQRNFTESIQTVLIDSQSGIMQPFYDADIGLIYVPGRGEGNIKYFDFSNSTIKFASEYRSTVPQKSICWFPKKNMNYNKCEIARFAKLTTNSIEYVSFFVPKRNEGYDATVYPDCLAGEAALTYDAWIAGENADPIRKEITTLENTFSSGDMKFEKKDDEVEQMKRRHTVASNELTTQNKHLKEENQKLQDQLTSLNEKLQESERTTQEYKLVKEQLEEKVNQLTTEIKGLKEQLEEKVVQPAAEVNVEPVAEVEQPATEVHVEPVTEVEQPAAEVQEGTQA